MQRTEKPGIVAALANNLGVGLDTQLDPELQTEGLARELVVESRRGAPLP